MLVLPVACNEINPCGAGGASSQFLMEDQEVQSSEIAIEPVEGVVELMINMGYIPLQVAIHREFSFTGIAYACSPPPSYFVNDISTISVVSNNSFPGFEAGVELLPLIQRNRYGSLEPLEFPLSLEIGETVTLALISDKPIEKDHIFTIRSFTSDSQEFTSELNVTF